MGLKHVEGLVFFLQKFRLNTLRSLLCYQLKATLKIFKTKKIIELNFPWLIHFYGLRIVDTFLFSAITVQSINQSINLYDRNSNPHPLFPLININNFSYFYRCFTIDNSGILVIGIKKFLQKNFCHTFFFFFILP